jgi:predicted nuclease with TOPRIM domain
MRIIDEDSPGVVPFARPNGETGGSGQVDQIGEAMLELIDRAAGIAEDNNRQAIDRAQKLSHQLHAAQDRIRELEAEMAALQERADRAQQWLHRVYTEIDEKFLNKKTRRAAAH